MATIHLVLDTRRARKDKTFNLVFRVSSGTRYVDISSGYTFTKKQFNSKKGVVLEDDEANEQLESLKAYYNNRLREFSITNNQEVNLKDLKQFLLNKNTCESIVSTFWDEHIHSLKEVGRVGSADSYKTSLSIIGKEMNLNVSFNNLSHKDITILEAKLYKRGMTTNGIAVYMRSFRAICNKAVLHDIAKIENYPFRKFKIKKAKTVPRVITITEVQSFFKVSLSENDLCYKSWLIGKLIFMLRGINLRDLVLLTEDNIKNGRIIYKRIKTGKIYSIKITTEIKNVLDQFESKKTLLGIMDDSVLSCPEATLKQYKLRRSVVNNQLKKLGKMTESSIALSTYVFRYTYANVAKQLGFSKDLIAEALGHEYSSTITGIYLEHFDLEILDKMNNVVIQKVN